MVHALFSESVNSLLLAPLVEEGFVFPVSLPVSVLDYSKSYERILLKFFGGVRRGSRNSRLDFGDDLDAKVFYGILYLLLRCL